MLQGTPVYAVLHCPGLHGATPRPHRQTSSCTAAESTAEPASELHAPQTGPDPEAMALPPAPQAGHSVKRAHLKAELSNVRSGRVGGCDDVCGMNGDGARPLQNARGPAADRLAGDPGTSS